MKTLDIYIRWGKWKDQKLSRVRLCHDVQTGVHKDWGLNPFSLAVKDNRKLGER